MLHKEFIATHQVVIGYISLDSAWGLKLKWDLQHPENPSAIINGEDLNKNQVRCKDLTFSKKLGKEDIVRIYIDSHASIGTLSTKSTLWEFAKKLAYFISDQNVIVNLTGCSAGRGIKDNPIDDSINSSGAKLQKRLQELLQRNVSVVARTYSVFSETDNTNKNFWLFFSNDAGKKKTTDLNLDWDERHKKTSISKQPGSKVIFTVDSNGNQIKLDAYLFLWRIKVFKTLAVAKSNTFVQEKKLFIQNWIDAFEAMTDDQVYEIMSNEVKNSQTILKKQYYSPFQFKIANTYNKVLSLVESREKILASKYTIQQPTIL